MGVEGVWTSSRVKGRVLAGGGAAPHERGEAERARRAKPNKEERRIPTTLPSKMISIKRTKLTFAFVYIKFTN